MRTFQSIELFDDLDLRENLLVAATRPRWWSPLVDAVAPSRGRRDVDADAALDILGLGGLGSARPAELSHGQRRLAGVARALGTGRAVLLKNHGVVVCGASIEEAVVSIIMLENACQVQLIAEAAGEPAPEVPEADVRKLQHDISRADQFIVNFDYLARRVKRREGK